MTNEKCLTKAELVEAIFNIQQVDKQHAVQIVEDYLELIKEALEKEGKVMISGFGSFEVKAKPERKGRNPQTDKPMMLRARKVIRFKCSQLLRKAINNNNN